MKILFLSENTSDQKLFESILEDAFIKFESRTAKTEKDFTRHVTHFKPGVIIAGSAPAEFSIEDALRYLKDRQQAIAFVIVNSGKNIKTTRSLIAKGADDYVSKSNIHHLPVVVKNAIGKKNKEKKKTKMEMNMKESHEKLPTVFESEPECIFQIGLNGELIEMNPAALELTEASSKIEYGKSKLWEFIHKEDIKKIKSYHQSIFNGNEKDFTFRFVGLNGTPHLIAARAFPLRASGKSVTSVLFLGKDITGKKE